MTVETPETRKPVLVIYHANCTDGACAAWAAWKKFGEGAEYRAWNYGTPAPSDEEVAGREVFIVDFSFSRVDLLRINGVAKSLKVIDHHKSAQADLGDLPFALFEMNHSGAYLAYTEFNDGRSKKVPEIVKYVEDRDLWRFLLPKSKAVSAAISSMGVVEDFRKFDEAEKILNLTDEYSPFYGPGEMQAGLEYTDAFNAFVAMGEALLRADEQTVRIALTRQMKGKLGGYEVPIVNATTLFSETAGALAEGNLFGVAWFVRADGKIQVSLRVRQDSDFDVSLLAKTFGGGGHKKAAGFESDLPWRELFGIEDKV